jgi:cardiolipin synthase (CMP-forming)
MFEDRIKDKFVTKEADTNAFWTLPNVVSLLRILLTVPALWLFVIDRWTWGLVILGICVFSDWLDGFLARKSKSVSWYGKVLDPFADKVVALAMLLLMVIKMDFPLWIIIVMALRDLSIFVIGMLLYQKHKVVGGANVFGKIFIFLLTVAGIFWLLEYYLTIELYASVILYLASGMMFISWIVYLIQNFKMLTSQRKKPSTRSSETP